MLLNMAIQIKLTKTKLRNNLHLVEKKHHVVFQKVKVRLQVF